MPDLDYRTAFELAPIGLVLSRHRLMVDCNQQLLEMFGMEREQLIEQSFEVLYPSTAEFERTGESASPPAWTPPDVMPTSAS
jgi:PAS domain S-box-containing protein